VTPSVVPSLGGRYVTSRPVEGTTGGVTVRIDTGVEEGGEISVHYDPMIAKLVTHAPTRAEAVRAQAQALDGFALWGIRHNIPFLSALMANERWREGRLSTALIAETYPDGFAEAVPEGDALRPFLAVAASIDGQLHRRAHGLSGQLRPRAVDDAPQEKVVFVGRDPHSVRVVWRDDGEGSECTVSAEGAPSMRLRSAWRPGEPVWRGTIDGAQVSMQVRSILNGVALSHGGFSAELRVLTPRHAELAALMPVKLAPDLSKHLLCPMPGLVRSIFVTEGQAVRAGDALAVVEAMKMENLLRAERDGVVAKVHVGEGDVLAVDEAILDFA